MPSQSLSPLVIREPPRCRRLTRSLLVSDRLLCNRNHAREQAPQLVKGPGVVGQQPVLEPGQSFEYSSACPITCAPKEGYQVRTRVKICFFRVLFGFDPVLAVGYTWRGRTRRK